MFESASFISNTCENIVYPIGRVYLLLVKFI